LCLSLRFSADKFDERSNRFGVAHACVHFVRLKLSDGVPVSDQDLRPRKRRPDPTQQELELGGGYGATRPNDGIGASGSTSAAAPIRSIPK
jgi:hypothetical protein